MRSPRVVVPAIAVSAALAGAFAVVPAVVANDDTPARRVVVEAPRADGVQLLDAVQYVCRGVTVDPRVETVVVDCPR